MLCCDDEWWEVSGTIVDYGTRAGVLMGFSYEQTFTSSCRYVS